MKIKKVERKDKLKVQEVEITEPLVEDFLQAEKIAGTDRGFSYALALLSRIALFDGRKLPPEEIRKLSGKDFLELAEAFADFGLEEYAAELSSSQGRQGLG